MIVLVLSGEYFSQFDHQLMSHGAPTRRNNLKLHTAGV